MDSDPTSIGHRDIYRLQEEIVDGILRMERPEGGGNSSCLVFPDDFRDLLSDDVRQGRDRTVFLDFYRMRQHFVHLKIARQMDRHLFPSHE